MSPASDIISAIPNDDKKAQLEGTSPVANDGDSGAGGDGAAAIGEDESGDSILAVEERKEMQSATTALVGAGAGGMVAMTTAEAGAVQKEEIFAVASVAQVEGKVNAAGIISPSEENAGSDAAADDASAGARSDAATNAAAAAGSDVDTAAGTGDDAADFAPDASAREALSRITSPPIDITLGKLEGTPDSPSTAVTAPTADDTPEATPPNMSYLPEVISIIDNDVPGATTSDAPAVVAATDAPAVIAAIDAPAVIVATDAPAVIAATDAPAVVAVTDAPAVIAVTDASAVIAETDAPVVVAVPDAPAVVEVTDYPVVAAVTDAPAVVPVSDTPAVVAVTDYPAVAVVAVSETPSPVAVEHDISKEHDENNGDDHDEDASEIEAATEAVISAASAFAGKKTVEREVEGEHNMEPSPQKIVAEAPAQLASTAGESPEKVIQGSSTGGKGIAVGREMGSLLDQEVKVGDEMVSSPVSIVTAKEEMAVKGATENM